MNKWEKYFEILGLNESETKIFISMLKSGPETVQNIAKNVNFSRMTVYTAIQSLTKHGLVTSVERGKKQFYTAEPAERIIALAENKTSQMQSIIKDIKDNIQELKMIQKGDKPVVKLFEGMDAFTAIQEDVISSNASRICEFGNIDEIDRIYPYGVNIRKKYFGKLAKKPLERHLIFLSKEKRPRIEEPNKIVKYLPDHFKLNFTGDIFIYEDKIWLSNFKDNQLTVMIQNKELKDVVQAMFDIIWNNLK